MQVCVIAQLAGEAGRVGWEKKEEEDEKRILTQHIQTDCLVDATLQCLVGALAGVDYTVHFLTDVQLELQRGHCAAPESRLRCVINACNRTQKKKKMHQNVGRDFDLNWTSAAGSDMPCA